MPRTRRWLLIFFVAVLVGTAGWLIFRDSLSARWAALRTPAVTQKPLSIYEWRDLSVLETPEYLKTLEQLHKQGYRTIYVSLHGALSSPDPIAYGEQLAAVSKRLYGAGFELAGLAGDAAWAKPEHYPAMDELLYFVADYNARTKLPIRQIALDIEPYTAVPNMAAKDISQQLARVATHRLRGRPVVRRAGRFGRRKLCQRHGLPQQRARPRQFYRPGRAVLQSPPATGQFTRYLHRPRHRTQRTGQSHIQQQNQHRPTARHVQPGPAPAAAQPVRRHRH